MMFRTIYCRVVFWCNVRLLQNCNITSC